MGKNKFSLHAAVYLILVKNNQVLLLRRFNTGWEDGKYSLPSGHLDGGETIKEAMVREAKEEIGVDITEENLDIVHVMHRNSNSEYIDYFLVANAWDGNPTNTEPDKADTLDWFDVDNLPSNTLPYVKKAIDLYKNNIHFSEEGFGNE